VHQKQERQADRNGQQVRALPLGRPGLSKDRGIRQRISRALQDRKKAIRDGEARSPEGPLHRSGQNHSPGAHQSAP